MCVIFKAAQGYLNIRIYRHDHGCEGQIEKVSHKDDCLASQGFPSDDI